MVVSLNFISWKRHHYNKHYLEKYASKKYWIGLKQINENWEWMDTTAVDYTVWKKYNLTDEEFSVQKCMFVDGTGSWGRENCDVKLNFLCKFERTPLRLLYYSLPIFSLLLYHDCSGIVVQTGFH